MSRRPPPAGPLWDLLYAALAGVVGAYLLHAYFPGRANVDIRAQAEQALGAQAFSDWHPPVMSAVWKVLIDLTGEIGSLFVVQIVMYALGTWLLARLIRLRTHLRRLPLLALLLPLAPWSLSQIGMLWKDVQMACALLVGVLALTMIRPRRGMTWLWALPAISFLVYGAAVRKNALAALVPIAVYLASLLLRALRARARPLRGAGRVRRIIVHLGAPVAVLGVLAALTVGAGRAVEAATPVEKTGQFSQVMLDDVMFSVPDAELRASDAPVELISRISAARDECLAAGEMWDAYWNCYGRGESGRAFSPIAHQAELGQLWLSHVLTHPFRYLEYRGAVYSYYLFSSSLEYWESDWDGDAEAVGLGGGSRNADFVVRPYVEDFALGSFPFLFQPWFWAAGSAVLLGVAGRARRFTCEIRMLAASGLVYIAAYLPIVPANHFRYTYWPAIAATAAAVLLVAGVTAARAGREAPAGMGPVEEAPRARDGSAGAGTREPAARRPGRPDGRAPDSSRAP